jgi:hypothetical protein
LSENEYVQTRFREFYIASRERHDDFADQTDDVGIGAARYWTRNATSQRYNCTFCGQAPRQDRST